MTGARISLDGRGVAHVASADPAELYRGLGRCHAADRGLQMLLMRIVARGEASLHLEASDAMLEMDRFLLRMRWTSGGPAAAPALPPETRRLVDAYCAGVDEAFAEKAPWELRMLGYRPTPWTLDDILLLSRMVGYIALTQSQGEMERLLVEMVQAGVGRDRLEELFPGLLQGLHEELVRKLALERRLLPAGVAWARALPRFMASNNWVVSGRKSASGKPMLASDPHLEINRLPAVWYEIVLERERRAVMGATIPGLPAIIIGRSPELAWGVTYSFSDTVDSWIEECRDGAYRSGDQWRPFRVRQESIRRKKKPPVECTFYENEHGVLEGDPHKGGFYLATRWSGAESGVDSIVGFAGILEARTVREGMDHLGRVETAWNWVLADRAGDIGYQMSGLTPRRREGTRGLVPLPGWDPANDWRGYAAPSELPRCLNPEEGYFATANDDLNRWGTAQPINLPMGPYRADRIRSLLAAGSTFRASDFARMQMDLVSPQAEAFMNLLRPLLPDTPQGKILRDWDHSYGLDSQGAFLFERVYRSLMRAVFGGAIDPLFDRTIVMIDYYLNFDRILLSERSAWFGGETREALCRRAIAEALAVKPEPWGRSRRVTLSHLLFGGKLPRFLGFDRGPLPLPGGRATLHQGQVYTDGTRVTTFAPSYRFVADLAEDGAQSCLCGGPSDRRFSPRYASELEDWAAGRLKPLSGSPAAGA